MTKRIINQVSNNFDNEPAHNLKISEYSEAESKDLILNILLKYPNNKAGISDFKRILFPNDTNDDIKHLLILISEHIPEIADSKLKRYDLILSTNPRTKSFLRNGGFTKIEKDLKESISEKKSVNKSITNNNFGGTFIQESDLRKAQIINKPKTANNTPIKKYPIQKLLSNSWILLIVGAIIAAILNSDRIMGFINEIVNRL